MLCMEIMVIDLTNHTKYKNTLCGRNVGFHVLNLVSYIKADLCTLGPRFVFGCI
jgi:hypothetical protein